MSVLDDLGLFLQTAGVGTLGTTLFKGRIPMDAPHVLVEDAVLALIEVPGLPANRVHDGPAANIEQPMIQVLSRGHPHDYVEARTRAEAAYVALDGLTNVTLSGTFYLWIYAQQPPFVLRQADEMGRPLIVFSVRCGKQR
jgi:Bacteriophage minor capsid protein